MNYRLMILPVIVIAVVLGGARLRALGAASRLTRLQRREYVVTQVAAIGSGDQRSAVRARVPFRCSGARFHRPALGPSIACNALFCIGASLLTRTYCPGVVTSVVLYLPVALLMLAAVVRDEILFRCPKSHLGQGVRAMHKFVWGAGFRMGMPKRMPKPCAVRVYGHSSGFASTRSRDSTI